MKTYRQYCPIARGAEIFAERWTPLIIRNMFLGCTTMKEILDGAPGLPKGVLRQRLEMLERYGVVERRDKPAGRGYTYHLSDSGRELVDVCFALGNWGARWLEVAPEHLDSHVVLWSMARLIDRERLPARRVLIRFDITDLKRKNRFWMVVENEDIEVCLKHPGGNEELVITTTSRWLAEWHMGHISLAEAERREVMTIDGSSRVVRDFSSWGGLSPFAEVEPVAR